MRVLVADGSPLILMQHEDILTSMGYEVAGRASSGEEAVQRVRELRPDLVLMDIVMPGDPDGIGAAGLILAEFDIPVILVTESADTKLVERAEQSGISCLLQKPIRQLELKAAIEIAGKRKGLENGLSDLYREVIENTNDVIYVVDGKGTLKLANERILKIGGYTRENMIGKSIASVLTPKSLKDAAEIFRRQVKGEDVGLFEIEVIDRTGNVHDVEIRERVVWKDGRIVEVQGIGRDVTERKRIEEALKESEERYRNLFENSIEPVVITDFRGIITSANRSLSEVSGYSIEELVGKNYRELTTEEEAQEIHEVYSRLYRTGEPVRDIAFHMKHKTGEKREALFCVDVLRKGNEIVGFQATIRDITDKHRIEAALKESEQRLKLAVDAAQIGLWDWDIRSDRIFRSKWWFKMLGYSVGEIEPTRTAWAALVHPDDIEGALRAEDEHVRGKTPFYQHEYRILSKTGDYRWVLDRGHFVEWDNDGKPVRATGTHIDITERKKVEEALKESEENLREEKAFAEKLLYAPSDTVFVFEPATGKAIRWNEVFREVTGYSDEEIASMKAPDAYYSEEDLKRAREVMLRIMSEGRGTVELSLITKDGRSIPFEYSASIVTDKDGSPRFFISIGRDITERKQAEEALKKSEAYSRSLLEAVPDLILVLNRDGTYVDFKADRDEELAIPRSEIIGKSIKDIGLSREHLEDAFFHIEQAIATNEVEEFEYDLVLPHGPTSWSARMVAIGDGEVFVLARNITERKRAEEAIKLSESTYREIFNTVNDTIWIHDIETWQFLDVNNNVTDMFGYSVSEAMGLSVEDISSGIPPYTREVAVELLKKAAAGEPQRFEWHCRHKDGHLFWNEVNLKRGTIAGKECILAIERDITERKRAEDERVKTWALLDAAITQSPSGILIADAPDVTIRMANPAAFGISGGTDQSLTGIDVTNHSINWQTFRPDGSPYPSEELPLTRAVLRGETTRNEEAIIRNERGEDHWISVNAAPVRNPEGNITAGILLFHDITDRRLAEEALRENEIKYRTLVETLQEGVWVIDRDAKTLYVNPRMADILGYAVDEMEGMHLFSFMDESEIEKAKERLGRRKQGIREKHEFIFSRKDGRRVFTELETSPIMDTNGNYDGAIAAVSDITDRKIAEEALKESEAKFRSVFETSRDFMYITSLDGKILDYSVSAKEFFDYSDEEIRNMTILELYHDPEDRAKLIDKLKADGFAQNYELRLKKKDGSLINALATIAVRRDTKGDIIGFQESVKDISQMRRLEQQLIQAEKLSGLGTLISGVAHELNNPLTAIMGNAEVTLMDRALPEKNIKSLEVILKESERAARIINSLLIFAREHTQERRMILVNDIIRESYKLREYGLRVSDIDVKLSLTDDLPPTYADPYQLQQVFINIINNAFDVLREQGGGTLTIRSFRKDEKLAVEFEDNGPGIEKETVGKIFDPFFTTKDVGKGTGLGLSMAYGIVKDHDGSISVESEQGSGAKFTVSLPITRGPDKEKKKPEEKETGITGKSILVVDDEDSVRDILYDVLSAKGHIVKVASSGVDALTLIGKERFDAIVLDVKMPEMGGKELYIHISDDYPQMLKRIVFMTGDILSGETQTFLTGVENRCIEKPFRTESLLKILNDVLEQ